jgi:photosystem II stability/assembly factor-like uncharacterized protein
VADLSEAAALHLQEVATSLRPNRPVLPRRLWVTLTAIAVLVCARTGSANGRFPAANQLTVDPNDANHIVVSTTFGLLESRDGGKSFDYRCELALGITGEEDTMAAITESGTTVISTFTGILTTSDGCAYRMPPELSGKIVPDLTWSRSTPHQVMAFHEIGVMEGKYDSHVVRSDDDGQTWSDVGGALPSELFPLTIDIAPSDFSIVYLSGYLGKADDFVSVLMRSGDGGATFERHLVPESTGMRGAYIAAVHPLDAERVYLRVDDSPGTVIWESDDGGVTFRKLFTGAGKLTGLALSPDGTELAFGGKDDGIYGGPSDGSNFQRRSDVGPLCLTWTPFALYACADSKTSGFSIGRSVDGGTTFQRLLAFDELCGVTGCSETTRVGMTCPEAWEQIAPRLGTMCGVPDAGAPQEASVSEADDAGAALVDAGLARSLFAAEASGGCSIGRRVSAQGAGWALTLLALVTFSRKRARH